MIIIFTLTSFGWFIDFFPLKVNTFSHFLKCTWAVKDTRLGLIICQNQFALIEAQSRQPLPLLLERASSEMQVVPFWKSFVRLCQETSVSFLCQRHCLSSSIPCSNCFAGKHSNSSELYCPSHHLFGKTELTAHLKRDWRHPLGLYKSYPYTIASPRMPNLSAHSNKADRSLHPGVSFAYTPPSDRRGREQSVRFPQNEGNIDWHTKVEGRLLI